MCGRAYVTFTDEELEMRYLTERSKRRPLSKPNYNLAPTQETVIVLNEQGERELEQLRWGLIPYWAKDPSIGSRMINARSEGIEDKPAFRDAFKKRRCIVPVSGFYEWKREGDKKQPYCIRFKDASMISLAGLWDSWRAPDGREVRTFTIITTSPNDLMASIHDRMPVILASKAEEEEWLSPLTTKSRLLELLRPCSPGLLEAYPISTLVNSPKNTGEELLTPLVVHRALKI